MNGPTEVQGAWVLRVLGIGGASQGAPGGAVVRLAKGMLLWNQTRSSVSQQVKTLQQAILKAAANVPEFDEIQSNIGNLEEILEILDDRLTVKLNELRGTTDAAEKQKLSEDARQIVAEYQTYAASDELMNDIDDNGFIPLTIKSQVITALDEVMSMI